MNIQEVDVSSCALLGRRAKVLDHFRDPDPSLFLLHTQRLHDMVDSSDDSGPLSSHLPLPGATHTCSKNLEVHERSEQRGPGQGLTAMGIVRPRLTIAAGRREVGLSPPTLRAGANRKQPGMQVRKILRIENWLILQERGNFSVFSEGLLRYRQS
jgi:hypothetical protein